VRGDHHGRAAGQGHLDAGHRSADAGVLGDVARVVLRHVEVGPDEDAAAAGTAFVAEVGKAQDIHGGSLSNEGNPSF
jgi:hypothetical protein